MNVVRAKNAGFCMGVALALEKLEQAMTNASKQDNIVTFGPIIHNPQVLEEYRTRGVTCTENISEIRQGDIVIIRAHGIPLDIERALRETGATLIDATCPRVKKAQSVIADQAKLGRKLLLLGEAKHPEVRGLVSYALPGALVFESLQELQDMQPDPSGSWFLATQTTQDIEEFEKATAWITAHLGRKIPVLSTICGATRVRQEDTRKLAATVDAMVVIGGLESGNTRRLAELVEEMGVKVWHVEVPDELPLDCLRGLSVIGLTAGASTPKGQIDEAQHFLEAI